jgi:hypothetical protein
MSQPGGPVALGANFTIAILLRDFRGGPIPLGGHPVSIAISSGGGTLNGNVSEPTIANGSATFTVSVAGSAGARTFTISGAGLVSAVTGSITFQ